MPRQQRHCEPALKNLDQSHRKCSKHTPPTIYETDVLIDFFGGTADATAALSKKSSWRVCAGLRQKVKAHIERLRSTVDVEVEPPCRPVRLGMIQEAGQDKEPPPHHFESRKRRYYPNERRIIFGIAFGI